VSLRRKWCWPPDLAAIWAWHPLLSWTVVHARRAGKDASRRWLLLATRNRAYGLRCEPHTRLLRPLREPALWTSDAQHRYLIVVATARAPLPFSFGVPAQGPGESIQQRES